MEWNKLLLTWTKQSQEATCRARTASKGQAQSQRDICTVLVPNREEHRNILLTQIRGKSRNFYTNFNGGTFRIEKGEIVFSWFVVDCLGHDKDLHWTRTLQANCI